MTNKLTKEQIQIGLEKKAQLVIEGKELKQDWVNRMDNYTAKNIRVLNEDECFERMPWLKAETLASKYNKDKDFIERGLLACRVANVGEQYFIQRYLEKDCSVPINKDVDYQSRIIQGLVKE